MGHLCKFISADGLERYERLETFQRTYRRVIFQAPPLRSVADLPDPIDASSQERIYEFFGAETDRFAYYQYGERSAYVYRERVLSPPPRESVTVAALARALFEEAHREEADRVSEGRGSELARIFGVMWTKTKAHLVDGCTKRAHALLAAARRSGC